LPQNIRSKTFTLDSRPDKLIIDVSADNGIIIRMVLKSKFISVKQEHILTRKKRYVLSLHPDNVVEIRQY
jgi:hypothetical protein